MDTTPTRYTPSRMFRIRKQIHSAPLLSVAGLLTMGLILALALSLASLLAYRQFTAASVVALAGVLGYRVFLSHRTRDYLEGLWLLDAKRFDTLEQDLYKVFNSTTAQPSPLFFDAYNRSRELLDAGFVPHTAKVSELSSELATARKELTLSTLPFMAHEDQA